MARHAGYTRLTLWTNNVMQSARHRYQSAEFRLLAVAPHRRFGRELIGATWEQELDAADERPPMPSGRR